MNTELLTLDSLEKLTEPEMRLLKRDIREAAKHMTPHEARFFVDLYYTMQRYRIRMANQITALVLSKSDEPFSLVHLMLAKAGLLENEIKGDLDSFSAARPLGEWARSNKGVGPIIAAGLLAHIDLDKAKTAGAIWRFAGLDPTVKWLPKTKRPWNASLKVLCWKLGQSFMKLHKNEDCFYGQIYKDRKTFEIARNESGANKDTAEQSLAEKKFRADTATRKAYEAGCLPDGRIELRAERYAVKMFLSHYFAVGYEMKHGERAPIPYIIQYGGHTHEIRPPNWPMK